jgi:hypothetical protein
MPPFCLKRKPAATTLLAGVFRVLMLLSLFFAAASFFTAQRVKASDQELVETRPVLETGRFYRIGVPADVPWTDTRFDVKAGQRITFLARGGISLQQGNPRGYCGPDGLGFSTVQQPIPDTNFGALIGKVVLLISVEVDEETGEETRNEIIEYFYIGSEQSVEMPIDGGLFLGINELVVEDNSGILSVQFELIERILPVVFPGREE